MATPRKKGLTALIEQFCAITGAATEIAEKLLEACNGDLQLAIEMHMDGATEHFLQEQGQGGSADIDGNGVRAPIPQKRDVLVDEPSTFGFRTRRRIARSVFDGFRDFQAEAKQQEQMLQTGSVSSKHRTLEDLFRPPIDLTFKGTFNNAREAGTSQSKWLMVNIQNVQEFACQTLNRDVWSNSTVRNIICEHFLLWQVYHDSEEGRKYMQFYKVTSWPYVAILDPRTGEKLAEWNKVDSLSFCDLVSEFLSDHPSLDGTSMHLPAAKRVKRETSIVDATEDDQLQAAIQASLEETNSPGQSGNVTSDEENVDLETFSGSDEEIDSSPAVQTNFSDKLCPKSNGSSKKLLQDIPHRSTCTNESLEAFSVEIPSSSSSSSAASSFNVVKGEDNDDEEGYSECADGEQQDPITNLMLRFPDSKKRQISLPCSSKLMALVKYVVDEGYSSEKYELVTNFPRRKLSSLDHDKTLKELQLYPQETVFIQASLLRWARQRDQVPRYLGDRLASILDPVS